MTKRVTVEEMIDIYDTLAGFAMGDTNFNKHEKNVITAIRATLKEHSALKAKVGRYIKRAQAIKVDVLFKAEFTMSAKLIRDLAAEEEKDGKDVPV